MRTLFKHQEEGVRFLQDKGRAILADQQGLGKTLQAIMASEGKTLIVCPASLKLNWMREIKEEKPDAIVVVLSGRNPGDEGFDAFYSAQFLIINYDIMEGWAPVLAAEAEKGTIQTVILDEAHYIKGQSKRTKATLSVTERAQRVYCLSGTPVMNRPIELFNLLKAIHHPLAADPNRTGSALRREYGVRYCGAYWHTMGHIGFWDESGSTRIPELKEKLRGYMLRRTKAEVLDLPEKIVSTMDCELTGEWKHAYDNAWDIYLDWLAAHPEGKNIENIMSAQQLVELMKLKQVCSQAKVPMVVEQVKEANAEGEGVIIFTQFTKTLDELRKTLGPVVGTANIYTLDGSNNMQEREHAVRGFQGSTVPAVFIGNIKAAGVGITLTKASTVIFADMDWSPAVNEQAEDRAHRIGQTGTVNVYYYICRGTIEEDIARVLLDKQGTIGELMGEETVQKALAEILAKKAVE